MGCLKIRNIVNVAPFTRNKLFPLFKLLGKRDIAGGSVVSASLFGTKNTAAAGDRAVDVGAGKAAVEGDFYAFFAKPAFQITVVRIIAFVRIGVFERIFCFHI